MIEAQWLSDHGPAWMHSYLWFVNERHFVVVRWDGSSKRRDLTNQWARLLPSHHQLVTNTEIGTTVSEWINTKRITLYKYIQHACSIILLLKRRWANCVVWMSLFLWHFIISDTHNFQTWHFHNFKISHIWQYYMCNFGLWHTNIFTPWYFYTYTSKLWLIRCEIFTFQHFHNFTLPDFLKCSNSFKTIQSYC